MSEATPEAPTEQAAQPETPTDDAKPEQPVDKTDWKAEAQKWEQRAKQNGAAAKDLEKQRLAAMTEAERAVVDAETRGRQTAVTEFGKRLARTEFDALAGRRNPEADTSKMLEFVDLAKFVGEDGEPDSKAIAAAVDQLVPAPTPGTPTSARTPFDLGNRGDTATPANPMNDAIRRATGRT